VPDFAGGLKWLKEKAGADLKVKIIVAIGVAGMLFILIGQLTSSGNSQKEDGQTPQNTLSAEYVSEEEYAQLLENKLRTLIGSIDGVGRLEVMVTLEQGVEYIYALEEKSSLDKTTGGEGEDSAILNYKHDVQSSYVFVDSGYGAKQPLLRTTASPKVQGVVVVCDGADDIRVEERIINVVTTALHIPTTRVCVVKINAD